MSDPFPDPDDEPENDWVDWLIAVTCGLIVAVLILYPIIKLIYSLL